MNILLYATTIRRLSENEFNILKTDVPDHIGQKANIKRPGSLFAWLLLKKAVCDNYGLVDLPKTAIAHGGKPFFVERPDICFSLSHNDYAAVCALFDSEIGCDVERADRSPAAVLMDKVMTAGEKAIIGSSCQDFMRLWTMKEAKLKMSGLGLAGGIASIDLTEVLKNGLKSDGDIYSTIMFEDNFITVCASKEAKELIKAVL